MAAAIVAAFVTGYVSYAQGSGTGGGVSGSGDSGSMRSGTGINSDAGGQENVNTRAGAGTGTGIGAGNADRGTIDGGTPAGVGMTAAPADMDSRQFDDYLSERWDADNNGTISSTEWNQASPAWFGDGNNDMGDFTDWDTNANGALDTNEFRNMSATTGVYGIYDTDGNGVIDGTEAGRMLR